jgi:hypothetical protein
METQPIFSHLQLILLHKIHNKSPMKNRKLKKWTIFFGGHPKQQKQTPFAKGLFERNGLNEI